MKKYKPFASARMIILFLILFTSKIFSQDFILTQANELIKCEITIDSPTNLQFIRDNRTFNLEKTLIAEYSILSTKKSSILEIMDITGTRLRGTFLFVENDSLYLWKGSEVYNPNLGTFIAININQANRLVLYRNGDFTKGLKTGALLGFSLSVAGGFISDDPSQTIPYAIGAMTTLGLIGGSIGSAIPHRIQLDDPKTELSAKLQIMMRYAMLKSPPIKSIGRDTHLSNWVSSDKSLFKSVDTRTTKMKQSQSSSDLMNAPIDQNVRVSHLDSVKSKAPSKGQTKVSIRIFSGLQMLSAQRNSINNSLEQSGQGGSEQYYSWVWGSGTVMYPVKLNSAAFRDFSIETKFKESHRLSISYTSTISFGAKGKLGLSEVGEKKALEFCYHYAPKPYSSFKVSHWESSLGIGPSINFLAVKVDYYNEYEYTSKYKMGLSGQLTCAYYATPNFSINIRTTGRIVPGMTIPKSPDLMEHKVNFSSVDIAFGIGVHF